MICLVIQTKITSCIRALVWCTYRSRSFHGVTSTFMFSAENKFRCSNFCIKSTDIVRDGGSVMKMSLYKKVGLSVLPQIAQYCTTEPINDVTYEEIVQGKKNNSIILIDVREPSEIAETGKLPGSIHIPLNDVTSALGTMPNNEFKRIYGVPKPGLNAPLVFSCRSGVRSKKAMDSVIKMGFKNARNYGGGFLDWAEKSK